MTHFLGRLVERARGTAARVEPIIAPRFAPAPVAEIASEIEALPPGSQIDRSPAQKKSPDREIVRQERADSTGPVEKTKARSTKPIPERLLAPLEVAATEAPLVVRQDELEEGATSLIRNRAARKELLPSSVTQRPGSPIPAPAAARARRGIERAAIAPNDMAREAPIIRVTIGRIEVRAAPAPAPAPRRPPRTAGPKLTLDAYLKSRKEGAR